MHLWSANDAAHVGGCGLQGSGSVRPSLAHTSTRSSSTGPSQHCTTAGVPSGVQQLPPWWPKPWLHQKSRTPRQQRGFCVMTCSEASASMRPCPCLGHRGWPGGRTSTLRYRVQPLYPPIGSETVNQALFILSVGGGGSLGGGGVAPTNTADRNHLHKHQLHNDHRHSKSTIM